jgi:hypothetical protein
LIASPEAAKRSAADTVCFAVDVVRFAFALDAAPLGADVARSVGAVLAAVALAALLAAARRALGRCGRVLGRLESTPRSPESCPDGACAAIADRRDARLSLALPERAPSPETLFGRWSLPEGLMPRASSRITEKDGEALA